MGFGLKQYILRRCWFLPLPAGVCGRKIYLVAVGIGSLRDKPKASHKKQSIPIMKVFPVPHAHIERTFNFILIYTWSKSVHKSRKASSRDEKTRNTSFNFSRLPTIFSVVWGNTRVGSTHRPPFFLSNNGSWRLSGSAHSGNFTVGMTVLQLLLVVLRARRDRLRWLVRWWRGSLKGGNQKPFLRRHTRIGGIDFIRNPSSAHSSGFTRKPSTRPSSG